MFGKCKYCNDLVSKVNNRIVIKCEKFPMILTRDFLNDTLEYNQIWSDKSYINLYKEYRKHYTIYDRWPLLLVYKIPIVVNRTHGRKQELIANFQFLRSRVFMDSVNLQTYIPKIFRIPSNILNDFTEVINNCLPYVDNGDGLLLWYNRYIEFLWLRDWDFFYKTSRYNIKEYRKGIISFSNFIYNDLIVRAKDKGITVSNIITRILQNRIKTASQE